MMYEKIDIPMGLIFIIKSTHTGFHRFIQFLNINIAKSYDMLQTCFKKSIVFIQKIINKIMPNMKLIILLCHNSALSFVDILQHYTTIEN